MSMDWLLTRIRACSDYINQAHEFTGMAGYLIDIQGYLLMLLAEQGPGIGQIVEIGSFAGKSTCWLARGSKRARREKIFAIDHFTGSPEHQLGQQCEEPLIVSEGTTFHEFLRNICKMGVEDYVTPILATSQDAVKEWSEPIRLLFIDGDHSYEASRLDFESWSPFVVEGGVIVFHDIGNFEGVTRFYSELLASNSGYTELCTLAGMNVVTKGVSGPV